MDKPDELKVSFDQNPAMQEYLADKQPGDRCEGEIQLTLKSQDTKGAVFTVEAIIPDGYEKAPDSEETNEPPAGPPISGPIAGSMSTGAIPTATAMMVQKRAVK